jgi:hypothetical protein
MPTSISTKHHRILSHYSPLISQVAKRHAPLVDIALAQPMNRIEIYDTNYAYSAR